MAGIIFGVLENQRTEQSKLECTKFNPFKLILFEFCLLLFNDRCILFITTYIVCKYLLSNRHDSLVSSAASNLKRGPENTNKDKNTYFCTLLQVSSLVVNVGNSFQFLHT